MKNQITGQFESPSLDSMWPQLKPETQKGLDEAQQELDRA
jgi:hypothetical protein